MSDDRLTELEVRIAYQEQVIAALDEVVRDFANRVLELERRLREREAAELPVGPQNEPPPHY